jgi:hypothetical protein
VFEKVKTYQIIYYLKLTSSSCSLNDGGTITQVSCVLDFLY